MATKRRWQVTVEVGVFWVGPEYVLGVYRWKWLAFAAARWELFWFPLRSAVIREMEV